MEPLPPINKFYSLVVQEESNQKPVNVTEEGNSLLVNVAQRFDHKGKPQHFKNPPRQCTLFNRSGHTIDFCYQKHGHLNFNKNKSHVNASTSQNCDLAQLMDTSAVTSHENNNSTISQ